MLLAAPPGFRPAHLKACVEAGKHVFCEKPVAVDGPGVRSVLQTVEEARKKNLALVSGLCWRYSTAERATFQQIHDGAIGKIVSLASTYLTGPIWNFVRQPGWSDMEYQMRNWYYYAWLSGDHIVEQAVHSIDKMAWAMNGEMPVKASAVGGRQVRNTPEFGHIYDHFSVTYDYANGVKGFHSCRQQQGCANETKDYIVGSKGNCEIEGSRRVHVIHGENEWKYSGTYNNMYQAEHDELFASIRKGRTYQRWRVDEPQHPHGDFGKNGCLHGPSHHLGTGSQFATGSHASQIRLDRVAQRARSRFAWCYKVCVTVSAC